MNVQQLLLRARTMPGRRTIYWPGTGGRDPAAPLATETVRPARVWADLDCAQKLELKPFADAAGIKLEDRDAEREACDCSGFVCWALGLARHQTSAASWTSPNGWINTDSIWCDASGEQGMFVHLPTGRLTAGALLVYPKPPDRAYGHIGIVSELLVDGRAARVLHCSAENFKTAADAIAETGTAPFDDPALHSIAVWLRSLGEPPRIAHG